MALIDGEYKPDDAVSPKLHRYIGMWRMPLSQCIAMTANIDVLCPCGKILRYREEGRQHYMQGCFDVPQYVTIKESV